MTLDNPSDSGPKKFLDDQSFWRWYFSWRYEILEPLIALSGFANMMLKDSNNTLNKPLTDDDKHRFLEIIFNKAKSVRRALDMLHLFLGVRENGIDAVVMWNGESITKIVEEILDEIKNENKFVNVNLKKKTALPLIRTSEWRLRDALTILLNYIHNPEKKEWNISIDFEVIDDSFVGIEILTSFYRINWKSLTIEQLLNEPPNAIWMCKLLIESLDGKFDATIKDKEILYEIALPTWLLPETVEKTVRINLEDQFVDLLLGQELRVEKVLEEGVEYDISLVEQVDGDRSIVAKIAQGQGQNEGIYKLSFASVKVGSTDIKLRYSPPDREPTFFTIHIVVNPQKSKIE